MPILYLKKISFASCEQDSVTTMEQSHVHLVIIRDPRSEVKSDGDVSLHVQ